MGGAFSCCKKSFYYLCKYPLSIFSGNNQGNYSRSKNAFSNLPVILENPESECREELKTMENDEENHIEGTKIEMSELKNEEAHSASYTELIDIGKDAVKALKLRLNEGYEGFDEIYTEKEKSHNMRIFMKSYKNSEGFQIAIYKSEYEFPCSARTYLKFLNNFEIQKSLTKNYDEYKVVDAFHRNFSLYYICYSKTLFTSARDFIYIKHNTQEGNTFYDVTKSIDDTEKYPVKDSTVRGDIVLSGYVIEDLGEEKCYVRLYSETDCKLKVSPNMIKNMSIKEMRNYVDQSIEKVKQSRSDNLL